MTIDTTTSESVQVLHGHVSPETAFLVADYPFGFRLRCQIRYWLETHPKRGTRFMSQTTNPKKAGIVWNKPKASTYHEGVALLVMGEDGHVTWATMCMWDAEHVLAFLAKYDAGMTYEQHRYAGMALETFAKYDAYKAAALHDAEVAYATICLGGHPDPKFGFTHYIDYPAPQIGEAKRNYLKPSRKNPDEYAEYDIDSRTTDLTCGMVINGGSLSRYPTAIAL